MRIRSVGNAAARVGFVPKQSLTGTAELGSDSLPMELSPREWVGGSRRRSTKDVLSEGTLLAQQPLVASAMVHPGPHQS